MSVGGLAAMAFDGSPERGPREAGGLPGAGSGCRFESETPERPA